MSLLALVVTLGLAASPPEVLLDYGLVEGGRATTLLTIASDGSWTAGGAAGGKLAADEVTALEAAIAQAELTATRGPPCPGRPGLIFLRVARGEVRWSSGCGFVPHASVLAVVQLAESLTTRRPPPLLVKVVRQRTGDPTSEETVALMRSGAWTTHRGRGTLDAATMTKIIAAFDAASIEAPPIPDHAVCRGDFPHHIDVPGRGEVRFIWPCAKPSPTLQVALDLVYASVGLPSP